MANRYVHYWDKTKGKKVYGGKYPKINESRNREFDNLRPDNIGEEGKSSDRKVESGFDNLRDDQYPFSDRVHGTIIITANSYPEALRQAKLRGYEESDYQGDKRRKRRGK